MDLVIRGGTVIDGSGSPGAVADVAIQDNKIVGVGKLPTGIALQEIDARGMLVAPGFIDIHTHSDLTLLLDGSAESLVTQGVTTQVIGNCGMSVAPILPGRSEAVAASIPFLLGGIDIDMTWHSLPEYLERLEGAGLAANVATQVGHGTLRANVSELDDAPLGRDELQKLRAITGGVLEDGAVGITTGLIYPPGNFATFAELVAVNEVVAHFGRTYATHLRGYRALLEPSVREAIEFGRTTGAAIHLSHLKAAGKVNRDRGAEILRWVDDAQQEGLDVTFDVYPYEAGNTALLSLFPRSTRSGGKEATRERLMDRSTRSLLREAIHLPEGDWEPLLERNEWGSITLVSFKRPENRRFEGRDLESIGEELGLHPLDAACDLLLAEDLVLNMVNFHVAEPDIEAFLKHPSCIVASDGISVGRTPSTSGIRPHPRFFGTFPRIFRRFVRERAALTLEEAVHKMTGAPAARMGMSDRGAIAEGLIADLVVFDAAEFADRATYEQPSELACGLEWVIVGGKVVCQGSVLTSERPGRVIRA